MACRPSDCVRGASLKLAISRPWIFFGYRPDQSLMVACHKCDLRAAKGVGMRTAFVARRSNFVLIQDLISHQRVE
jgi:hypothetical protein